MVGMVNDSQVRKLVWVSLFGTAFLVLLFLGESAIRGQTTEWSGIAFWATVVALGMVVFVAWRLYRPFR